ncbi:MULTISPECIES: hypothetical protein [Acetobacterales]|uniref:hypothetical protein n=1 Tax=Roseomonas sp. WGS1072 TaxID=3366816 RepID=UPI003BF03982
MPIQLVDPSPEQLAETMLSRAAALGRRDGLCGPAQDAAAMALGEGIGLDLLARRAPQDWLVVPGQRALLMAALRQCYRAGRAHGAEVRRENDARRATRS